MHAASSILPYYYLAKFLVKHTMDIKPYIYLYSVKCYHIKKCFQIKVADVKEIYREPIQRLEMPHFVVRHTRFIVQPSVES
jgi:hypothetical protein